MTIPTPQDRLQAVEAHAYTLQAIAESYRAIAAMAYQTNNESLSFLIGLLADRLQDEVERILTAASRP